MNISTYHRIAATPRLNRRSLLLGSLSVVTITPPALAIAPMVLLIGPTILAGVLAIVGIRMQLRSSDRQHAEQMRLNQANIEIAQAQLAAQSQQAMRQERLAILTTLLGRNEALADRYAQGLLKRESLAFDLDGSESTALLSGNADGRGTALGLSNGNLAMERGGHGAPINNKNACDLGQLAARDGDALHLPVSGIIRDLDARASAVLRERFAVERGLDPALPGYTLASAQAFSRARTPRGNPDTYAAGFIPSNGGAVEYAYVNARG